MPGSMEFELGRMDHRTAAGGAVAMSRGSPRLPEGSRSFDHLVCINIFSWMILLHRKIGWIVLTGEAECPVS